MIKSRKLPRSIALAMATAGVLLAFGAASASAASWSTGYPVVAKGSVTFERSDGGVAPVTCGVEETWSAEQRFLRFKCPRGVVPGFGGMTPYIYTANGVESPRIIGISGGVTDNPWNFDYWNKGAFGAAFVNGNLSEPSHFVLNKQAMGQIVGGGWPTVYATGKINVTTPTGGLTTIVP